MNLPGDFTQYMRQLVGDEELAKLTAALTVKPPVSIRLNPFKRHLNTEIPLKSGGVPWCETGLYLGERPNFTFDPMLHAGLYYVQEASSMFLSHVIRQCIKRPVMMLDLCAAPGGKSTTARGVLPEGSLLYCNEPMRARAQILRENMLKFGHPDVIVTNNLPRDFKKMGTVFDVVLTDVPCSGEGMFRKDEGAIDEWSLANVDRCRKIQREIVLDIWDSLAAGGLLIYSTCTFNTRENEENVAWIASELGADIIPVDIDGDWGITGSLLPALNAPVYRFLPGKTRGEGLFMAVLRKRGDTGGEKKNKAKSTISRLSNDWVKDCENYDFIRNGMSIVAIPKRWVNEYNTANAHLKVIHAGIDIGEYKGSVIIPVQGLALSTALAMDKFHNVELTYPQAIQYLRKEAITLPPGTPTGFVLMTYEGVPLGFGKNVGNRVNNLYPAEWKIKSTHIPQCDNEVMNIKQ